MSFRFLRVVEGLKSTAERCIPPQLQSSGDFRTVHYHKTNITQTTPVSSANGRHLTPHLFAVPVEGGGELVVLVAAGSDGVTDPLVAEAEAPVVESAAITCPALEQSPSSH